MSGGDAPKVKETPAEKIAASKASARWNERQQDGYLDLEVAQVADSERDYREFFAGRTSADIAKKELEANKGLGTATVQKLGDLSDTVREASAVGKTDAAIQAQAIKDNRRVASSKLGSDIAGAALQGFDTTAAMAGQRAVDKVQNKIIKNNARNQMVMDLASAAATGYGMKKAGYSVGKKGISGPETQVYDAKQGKNVTQAGRNYGWSPLLQGL
jgi:hypothetical protein